MPEKWSLVPGDQLILNSNSYGRVCKHDVECDLRNGSNYIWKDKRYPQFVFSV